MKYVKIKSIKKINVLDRYDLTINSTHNFFANNILIHNTSGISSKILCKKKLNSFEKLLKKFGINIIDSEYDYIYSSRKVIKNPNLNPNAKHYYKDDIWGIADAELRPFLQNGITFYYEIVGYLPDGGMIQKSFDYGYIQPKHDRYIEGENYGIYIYRITYTNNEGKVFEFSAKQVQDFCKEKGLKAVPELYYGYAINFTGVMPLKQDQNNLYQYSIEDWKNHFLTALKSQYNEKNCFMCKNKVPEEGCVVRIEGTDLEVYKCKSTAFLEFETKQLDKGEIDLESEN